MTYNNDELRKMESWFKADRPVEKIGFDYDLDKDCLVLEDIVVHWSSGGSFERYDRLIIPKKYPQEDGLVITGALYEVSEKYEDEGWFVPSMGLSCAILTKLINDCSYLDDDFDRKPTDLEIWNTLLDDGFPFHPKNLVITNTLIDYQKKEIIHYPYPHESLLASGDSGVALSNEITDPKRFVQPFNPELLSPESYWSGMKEENNAYMFDICGGKAFNPMDICSMYEKVRFDIDMGVKDGEVYVSHPELAGMGFAGSNQQTLKLSTTQFPSYQTKMPLVKEVKK